MTEVKKKENKLGVDRYRIIRYQPIKAKTSFVAHLQSNNHKELCYFW